MEDHSAVVLCVVHALSILSHRHTHPGLDWIRMRNNGGTYTLQFSESLKEDEFIIAPTMDFQVIIGLHPTSTRDH
jgi:hypothetical protein